MFLSHMFTKEHHTQEARNGLESHPGCTMPGILCFLVLALAHDSDYG